MHLKALPIGSAFTFANPHKIATFSRTSEKVLKKLIFISIEKCGKSEIIVLKKMWKI